MSSSISPNTTATLLLTAPLLTGRTDPSSDLLTPSEYNRLEHLLHDRGLQPADLIERDAIDLPTEDEKGVAPDRLARLLERGLLLSQAIERWHARSVWVVSRADEAYPVRLKARLKDHAPSVIYGCGEQAILGGGGLAIVGSRNADDSLLRMTEGIGRLAAESHCTVFSGGARGIDQAAMRGALEAGGKVGGIMADSLERAAVAREHRDFLMDGLLVLISPYDPAAGFNVGHAMGRNKLIYALADAGLVMSSDFEKGGTWAGAIEQLKKLKLVPVYVHPRGESGKALEALVSMGALRWPDPVTAEGFVEALAVTNPIKDEPVGKQGLLFQPDSE